MGVGARNGEEVLICWSMSQTYRNLQSKLKLFSLNILVGLQFVWSRLQLVYPSLASYKDAPKEEEVWGKEMEEKNS